MHGIVFNLRQLRIFFPGLVLSQVSLKMKMATMLTAIVKPLESLDVTWEKYANFDAVLSTQRKGLGEESINRRGKELAYSLSIHRTFSAAGLQIF